MVGRRARSRLAVRAVELDEGVKMDGTDWVRARAEWMVLPDRLVKGEDIVEEKKCSDGEGEGVGEGAVAQREVVEEVLRWLGLTVLMVLLLRRSSCRLFWNQTVTERISGLENKRLGSVSNGEETMERRGQGGSFVGIMVRDG